MVSRFQALEKLSRREATHEDFSAWHRQVRGLKNDRGAAILLAANVEASLDKALERFLFYKEPTIGRIFSDDGPLANFNRKCLMGRALGIYGDKTFKNLDIIRRVRNAFAHAHSPVTFKTDEIASVCTDLVELELIYPKVARKHIPRFPKSSPRARYKFACDTIAHNLIWHSLSPITEVDQDALLPSISRRENEDLYFKKSPLA